VRRNLRKALWASASAGLMLAVLAVPAGSAMAATSKVAPQTSDTLYTCNYQVHDQPTVVWNFPGGAGRPGNTAAANTINTPFSSVPWISSTTINGQRWIYGKLNGDALLPYGWVGRDWLENPICGTSTYETTNAIVASTNDGDPFSSEPSEISASFRGQKWVWGVDPFVSSQPGWVGINYLKLTSCDSSGCYYDINGTGIHQWAFVGGADGP
jgi:hypothetical protein